FGLSPQEWQQKQNWSIQQAVKELFAQVNKAPALPVPELPVDGESRKMMDKEDLKEIIKAQRQQVGEIGVAWLERMANPAERALLERMTFFWHGHFATQIKAGRSAVLQLNALRTHALGHFRDLVLAIAQDSAMIRFLNNQQNRKDSPNENFARELLELFTLGRGNYSEKDIKEAARAFTGWSSTLTGEFVFRAGQHDYGSKTFFGKTGNFNGEDIIDLILEKRACAEFITRKMYRYFVNEQVDELIVKDLADQFYKSDYDIGQLMRTIFTSDWFYDKKNIGTRIKSPVELLAGICRTLNVDFQNKQAVVFLQRALGQMLFNPPNVAGWAGGKSWIDNATLMLRLNLVPNLVNAAELTLRVKAQAEEPETDAKERRLSARVDFAPLEQLIGNQGQMEALEELTQYLLQTPVVVGNTKLLQAYERTGKADFVKTATMMLMALPEYQVC
ncbi:MAG: DUF1800 family protein, partial [Saprospiraceae bacterium]